MRTTRKSVFVPLKISGRWCFIAATILPLTFLTGCIDTLERRKSAAEEVKALVRDAQDPLKKDAAVTKLLQIAQSRYSFGATWAAGSFGELGEAARPAVPVLARLMTSRDGFVAREAAKSLAELGPISKSAIPQLEDRVLHEYERDVVWFAVEALGNIGKPAVGALPLLRERLAECDEASRRKGGESPGGETLPERLREAIRKLEAIE